MNAARLSTSAVMLTSSNLRKSSDCVTKGKQKKASLRHGTFRAHPRLALVNRSKQPRPWNRQIAAALCPPPQQSANDIDEVQNLNLTKNKLSTRDKTSFLE